MRKLIQILICILVPFVFKNMFWIQDGYPFNPRVWGRGSSHALQQRFQSKNMSQAVNSRNNFWQTGVSAAARKSGGDLRSLLANIPAPVFVTYGNQGYSTILKNFVCNMALFPPMHRHMLIIVSENRTADMILSLSAEVSVWVALSPLTDSYDFETPDYIRLMMHRGNVLVNILELAQTQGKAVVWIEPDFHYTQNLLDRPEITQTVSDIVLFWDFINFCGCFIRFAPVTGSLLFYKEIMDRMGKDQTIGGMTNDQIILNSVVADMLPNYTLFDPCLYRSGLNSKAKQRERGEEVCLGIYPVAQHHNWIVGVQKKEQMAKDERGWFLNSDDMTCSTRDIRLVVMTMNRAWSLERLLKSLDQARYPLGASVDLQVTVDRDFNNNVDQPTMRMLKSLEWRHGMYEVKVWPQKVGLYGQWIGSWPAELYPDNLYRAVILLEDDLEVSPYYFQWFTGAHERYGGIQGVGAFTGQRPNLVAAITGPPSVESVVPGGTKAFGYMLIATWSLSPIPRVWREFRQWVEDKRSNNPDFIPSVPGIVPDQWYKQFRARGEEEGMWEMWFIHFADQRGLHTVYPWVSNGQETMVGNWREAGLHFSGAPTLDFPVCQEWDQSLLEEETPFPLVGYDLKFPPRKEQKHKWEAHFPPDLESIMRDSCISDICRSLASPLPDLHATLLQLGRQYESRERREHWEGADVLDLTDVMIQPEGDVEICNPIRHMQKIIGSRGCKLEDPVAAGETLCIQSTIQDTRETVIVISQMWGGGYFHTLVEGLPRLVSALNYLDARLEYPADWVVHGMVDSPLASQLAEFFGVKGFIHGQQHTRRALLPFPTPCGGSLGGRNTRELRQFIDRRLLTPVNPENKILVVIKRSASRALANHDDILSTCKRLWKSGEVVEHTGKGSFLEQVTLFHKASVVLGPHGAGLANAIAMRENTVMFEVIPETGINRLNMCYAALAFTLNIQYFAVRAPGFDSDGAAITLPISTVEKLHVFTSSISGPSSLTATHSPRRILIDLGANCGNSYEYFQSLVEEAFLVEPQEQVFKQWLIPRATDRVHVFLAAVSDHDEASVPFFIDSPYANERCTLDKGYPHGASSLDKEKATVDALQPSQQQVEMIDIARFMTDVVKARPEDHVIMKIDIEGAEIQVLKRLTETHLLDLIDDIQVEWHGDTQGFREEFESQGLKGYQEWKL